MMPRPRQLELRAVYAMGADGADKPCSFCKNTIYGTSTHYHVADIGSMCVSCLNMSHITFKGYDSYVSVMPTTPNSYAVRIV